LNRTGARRISDLSQKANRVGAVSGKKLRPNIRRLEESITMRPKAIAAYVLVLIAGTVLLPSGLQAQTSTYTYSYNGPALPIGRDSADIISLVNIFVPKGIRITKVTANVEIDYPRPGDLNIYMYSPILTRTKLLERNCGSLGSVVNVTFDDAAATRYSDTCPATAGAYRGNEPLANFNDQTALGTWSLAVENNGSDDFVGYIRGFTLNITGAAITNKPLTVANAVYNAADLESGAVAPGEMVNIQGFNLGPSPAVSAPAGDLPSALGGVQVTFDGAPAAIAYVSPYVLAVQVPFSVQAGKQTEMRVTYQTSSDPVMLDVLNAAPGLYTQNANGKGSVTAANPDWSMNSISHPAPKGQYVVVYAAGLGGLSPTLTTGKVPPASPVSNAVWPVTAVVDGITAPVSYAGAAPGYPGMYQINVQIPAGVASGARPLTVSAAGTPTQFGVTIFVQ
jgi:uncharacterized protein (TIGR03437 family)